MTPRMRSLLFSLALAAIVLAVPGVASANDHCTFQITPPNPGWRGASASIEGYNMSPNVSVYVNFNGNLVSGPGAKTNASGYVKVNFTIPNDAPTASNWVVFADSGCQMNDARNYTVNATAPTTTTTTSATTTTTTTTTLPPTTTTSAETTTTTTVAETTTTAAGETTTTTAPAGDTTTTTAAEDDEGEGGGGLSPMVYVIVGAAGAVLLLLVGRSMGGRK